MEKLVKLYISLHWMYPKLKYLEKENMKAVLDMLQTSCHFGWVCNVPQPQFLMPQNGDKHTSLEGLLSAWGMRRLTYL